MSWTLDLHNGNVGVRMVGCLSDATGAVRYDDTLEVRPPDGADAWIVAVVRGAGGPDPVLPPSRGERVLPLGFTHPIWLDADGNNEYDPPPRQNDEKD